MGAEKIWVGTTSGHEGEWDHAANWSPADEPVADDDVLLGPGGVQAVTSGLNNAAVSLNSISFTSEWGSAAVGSADNYLQINADTVVINCAGHIFLDLGTTSTLATITVNNSPTNRDHLHIKGNALALYANRGRLIYDSGALTTLVVQYAGSPAGDSDVLLSTPTVTNAYGLAGSLGMDGAGTITNLYLGASGTALISEGTLTNAYVYAGLLNWRTNQTLAAAYVYGGKLDATQDQRAKTLTALYMYGGAVANLAHGAGRITLTNKYEYGVNTVKVDP